jgi:hypothetical protein
MQPQKEHSDQYIASVLSYIRNSFGNKAQVIDNEDVNNLRKTTVDRVTPWTLDELNNWKKTVKK